MATEERSSGIEINGEVFDFPLIDETITLDEERILYLYADAVVKDFMPPHPEWDENEKLAYEIRRGHKFRNPDLKRALVHIAVKRAYPDRSSEDIEKALGAVSALAVDVAVVQAVDARPPAQTSQKQPESETSSNEPSSSTDSGRHTRNGSEIPVKTPPGIGISESDTSSLVALVEPLAS